MTVWLVGHFGETQIVGVFSSEDLARTAAADVASSLGCQLWIGSMEIDKTAPLEAAEWPGSYVWPAEK